MRKPVLFLSLVFISLIAFNSCQSGGETEQETETPMDAKSAMYTKVRLGTDLGTLSEKQERMIPILIEVAQIMDAIFWQQAYGDKEALLNGISDQRERDFAAINYGPWDRLNNNESFVGGVGEKPAGANFYPTDMTKEEFEAADLEDKTSLYTILRRNEAGELYTIPYHEAFAEETQRASDLLKKAAELAENEQLKKYLTLKAEALLTDEYRESDLAWMDMTTNQIDIITGPTETYEDQLFGYKASHTTYVLVKDMEWSARLAKYAALLPELQTGIPVPEAYKSEEPGANSQLAAFDVIYYAGDCNAGSKTIAVNLPNDEQVQLQKGTRRSQLKNAMRAKYDKILLPITDVLIDKDQRQYITFDAFFANTMFHEVAHGLGIKNTINGKGTVRSALKEHASALEEGKADVLGLYMVSKLHEKGEIEGDMKEYYTTFMASIFRSVRFGASSAHGKANMIRFNYFQEQGAFTRDTATGTYKIDYDKLKQAMNSLSEIILTLQGDGDYDGVAQLVDEKVVIKDQLQADLDKLASLGIPVDIVFDQGVDVLGLSNQ
ncbi:MAG: Zn-dependent hydrolase [Roseivirga sp.]|nr:Zn-dependent hydrolase [Roseivirga sp.]